MIETLIHDLSPPEQHAINLIKLAYDCFNSADGSGFFSGPERYAVLQERLPLVALQSQTLFAFWSKLLNKMAWSSPPKEYDNAILTLLQGDDSAVLRVFAEQAPSVVMLARYLHDQDKAARKEQRKKETHE